MNYLVVILPKLLSFLLLIGLGYLISALGLIRREGLSSLSALLIRVVLPCLTVSLMHQRGTSFASLLDCWQMVLWQVGGYLVLAAAGIACTRLFRIQPPRSNVHQGCMVGGNYAFVVIPMIMALYAGTEGEQYIPICSAVDTIVVWTLGLALFTRGTAVQGESKLKALCKRLMNPIIVAILGMLVLNSLRVSLPELVLDLCGDIGGISYSLGLIYVGCSVYYLNKGSLSLLKPVSLILVTKLFLVPLLVYLAASRFLPETESVILMLITGAPSMTTSVMIADQHGLDVDYAATAVFATTLGCLISVPLLFAVVALLHL
ncbi:MAG: AEC family transporter [Eubacteriales bacterium]|nr:AEC family transporter [Eubacteriales bacterium]